MVTTLIKFSLPGRLLFSKVWGSHSHNCALPTSDTDYLAVYCAPTKAVLSLDSPPETVTGKKPDYEAHEVAKFCRLLLKGNPAQIEMLFTDRMFEAGAEWAELCSYRDRFLSCHVVKQYIGYASAQLHKLATGRSLHTKGNTYNEKWAYHMIRLLLDGQRIATGKFPIVWKEGEERELLMSIRTEKLSQDAVERLSRSILEQIDAAKPWRLPEDGDKDLLNDWLYELRIADPRP